MYRTEPVKMPQSGKWPAIMWTEAIWQIIFKELHKFWSRDIRRKKYVLCQPLVKKGGLPLFLQFLGVSLPSLYHNIC